MRPPKNNVIGGNEVIWPFAWGFRRILFNRGAFKGQPVGNIIADDPFALRSAARPTRVFWASSVSFNLTSCSKG